MTAIDLGDANHCLDCGRGPAVKFGAVWLCNLHTRVHAIVRKAQSDAVIEVKNAEYWDFHGDVLARYVESAILATEVEAEKRGQNAERKACAELARKRARRYSEHPMFPSYCLNGMAQEAEDIAAAIEARKE